MHVLRHIDQMSPDRYSVGFTAPQAKDADSVAPPIDLEQAYSDRLDAIWALISAMETRMKKHYGLGANDFTVDER
jgi:hypothetical protein